MTFQPGDVVLVRFPWKTENGVEMKVRPALVFSVEGDQERCVIQFTTKNRSNQYKGKWILKDSDVGEAMGLLQDSFINLENSIILEAYYFIRLIGSCPIFDELVEIIEENNIRIPSTEL